MRNWVGRALAAVIFVTQAAVALADTGAAASWTERPDWRRHFEAAGTTGTILLHDLRRDTTLVYDPERARTGFLPASTFKIPNSLIGLETGAVKDAQEVFPWDGVRRDIAEWNQDLTLAAAIRVSAVPVYQEIARRIGTDRMARDVEAMRYGNADIKGAPIDLFWLEGNLRISAEQQIDFLSRLYRDDLPVSKRSLDIVKDMLIVEQTEAYTIRAKTGWVSQLGWWVGWVERGSDVYLFALNLDINKPEDAKSRIDITKAILKELGVI